MERGNFLREEYLTLRKEIENCIAEIALLERYAVIAIALIYAWLITQQKTVSPDLLNLAWAIPIFISVFGILRSLGIHGHLWFLGQYISNMECEIYTTATHIKGWEHFQAERKGRSRWKKYSTILFWTLLFGITTVVWSKVASG